MKKTQTEDRKLRLSKDMLRTLTASELVKVDGGLIIVVCRAQPDPYETQKTHG